jgi:hypothetical protein
VSEDDLPDVARHPYLPAGQALALRRPDGTALVYLPPEATDEMLAEVREVVEPRNDFVRAMNRLVRMAGTTSEEAEAIRTNLSGLGTNRS